MLPRDSQILTQWTRLTQPLMKGSVGSALLVPVSFRVFGSTCSSVTACGVWMWLLTCGVCCCRSRSLLNNRRVSGCLHDVEAHAGRDLRSSGCAGPFPSASAIY